MDIAAQRGYEAARPETRTTARVIGSGSFVEALVGAGAVALAILGLADILPLWMATIATIAIGAAFLIEGISISSRMAEMMESDKAGHFDIAEVGGGYPGISLVSVESPWDVGFTCIQPVTLMAIALIVWCGVLIRVVEPHPDSLSL